MKKKTIIQTVALEKSFSHSGIENKVLNGVSIDIYEKDFTVIMGSSGSGKSTLMYCLSGMDKPSRGTVFFQDEQLENLKENDLVKMRRKEVGFIFQQMHLIQNLKVLENIVISGYLIKQSPKDVQKRARSLLAKVGIADLEKRYPSQISGGQQQRVAIARALINSPTVIFADEPTGALNSTAGKDVLDILSDCSLEGQSIVMVTHDIKGAIRANRIIYVKDGSVLSEMSLPTYDSDSDPNEREERVQTWLKELGW